MNISLKYIPPVIVTGIALSMITSVTLSMSLGHKDSYLPTLSETGIQAPERYFFMGPLVIASVVFAFGSVALHSFYNNNFASDLHSTANLVEVYSSAHTHSFNLTQNNNNINNQNNINHSNNSFHNNNNNNHSNKSLPSPNDHSRTPSRDSLGAAEQGLSSETVPNKIFHCMRLSWFNNTALISGIAASVFLSLLAVVDLETAQSFHLFFAGVFFLSAMIHITSTTILSWHVLNYSMWRYFKVVVLLTTFVVWVALPIMIAIGVFAFCGPNNNCVGEAVLRTIGSILQYALVSCLLVFIGSYTHELKGMITVFRMPDEHPFDTLDDMDIWKTS